MLLLVSIRVIKKEKHNFDLTARNSVRIEVVLQRSWGLAVGIREVETIKIHHLAPDPNEIMNKLLVRI